ncbi:MAG: deoxynucleoside kinase [Alistipes indistinctus]
MPEISVRGKTSLTGILAGTDRCEGYYEDSDNPYIEFLRGYEPLVVQSADLFSRAAHPQAAAILSEGADLIQDRTICEDAYIFASNLHGLGLMSSRDFDTYMKIFDLATGLIRKPEPIDLSQSERPDPPSNRLRNSGRAYEASIQEGYLEQLNRKYEEWINNIYQGEVMTIDVDTVNFIENPSLLDGVVARIAEFKTRGR